MAQVSLAARNLASGDDATVLMQLEQMGIICSESTFDSTDGTGGGSEASTFFNHLLSCLDGIFFMYMYFVSAYRNGNVTLVRSAV